MQTSQLIRPPRWIRTPDAVLVALAGMVLASAPEWAACAESLPPEIFLGINRSKRFGLQLLDGRIKKKLTVDESGLTNSTWVSIDQVEMDLASDNSGHWQPNPNRGAPTADVATWLYHPRGTAVAQLRITQQLTLVPSQATRPLDTCEIVFKIENLDRVPHKVGLRVALDFRLNETRACPYLWPAEDITTGGMKDVVGEAVRSHFFFLERPKRNDPGLVAELRFSDREPDQVIITGSKSNAWPRWLIPVEAIKSRTVVALYWGPKQLKPSDHPFKFAFRIGKAALPNEAPDLAPRPAPLIPPPKSDPMGPPALTDFLNEFPAFHASNGHWFPRR